MLKFVSKVPCYHCSTDFDLCLFQGGPLLRLSVSATDTWLEHLWWGGFLTGYNCGLHCLW